LLCVLQLRVCSLPSGAAAVRFLLLKRQGLPCFRKIPDFCFVARHAHKLYPGQHKLTIRLFITMMLNFGITVAELVGGIISGSLSLISDALHNFSDGISIIISYTALRLGLRPRTESYTFGLKRAEILASIVNSVTLLGIGLYLIIESIDRFRNPMEINSLTMIWVASFGLAANIAGTMLLREGSRANINIRSAYLHLLTDAASSLAVILGGLAIYFYGLTWVDPALTMGISLYLMVAAFKIVRDATRILMMRAPVHLDLDAIRERLTREPKVCNLHHIHVWSLTDRQIHFEAHVEIENMTVEESEALIRYLSRILYDEFHIEHVTLQMETSPCATESL